MADFVAEVADEKATACLVSKRDLVATGRLAAAALRRHH
jgi:hypothetical protein